AVLERSQESNQWPRPAQKAEQTPASIAPWPARRLLVYPHSLEPQQSVSLAKRSEPFFLRLLLPDPLVPISRRARPTKPKSRRLSRRQPSSVRPPAPRNPPDRYLNLHGAEPRRGGTSSLVSAHPKLST